VKVLITGAAGQLGRELLASVPAGVEVVALDRAALDIADPDAVTKALDRHAPGVVLNAAAYTAVDRAEDETRQTYLVNAVGAANLADGARQLGARLIHVSSDYVFSGAGNRPCQPLDAMNPLGAYGRSKRDGEVAVLEAGGDALVLRSAWLYSVYGANFVRTILRLARERGHLRVVWDQVGSPTWAAGLARIMWQLAERRDVTGILHHADAGMASWYDFAVAIVDEAAHRGLLPSVVPVEPIATTDYPTRAPRPAFSVLDAGRTRELLGLPAVHWRVNLRTMLDQLRTFDG
jgi:dTDP-4-dehydrorhamnose reductase